MFQNFEYSKRDGRMLDALGNVFLYPDFCCDVRTSTWVAHQVAPGSHTVSIRWGMVGLREPDGAAVSQRTLVVQAIEREIVRVAN
jgi:hypothetical protein